MIILTYGIALGTQTHAQKAKDTFLQTETQTHPQPTTTTTTKEAYPD